MEAEVTRKIKKVFEKKVVKVAIIGFIVVILLGAAFLFYLSKVNASGKTTLKQQTAKVGRGNISVTVTGSGSLISSNRIAMTPSISGTITKVNFKEGDSVKKGDLMFEVDDTDAKLNVEKINNNIETAQLSQNSNNTSISELNVKAPFSGQVSNILVKQGDIINKNAPILTIIDQSKLKLLVPFNGSDIGAIKVGLQATVNLQGLMQTLEGKVTYVSNNSYSTATGGELYNVEVTVNNPGSLKEGMKGNVEVITSKGTQSSTDNGTLEYLNSAVLKSDTGGTVKSLNVIENQYVSGKDVLVTLQNDELVSTQQNNDLKLKDLQTQLDSANKQLANYKIYSSIDGTIVSQSSKIGDYVKSGDVISTVADGGHMEFTVPIDELDIAKVQIGQDVNVTVDALTDTALTPLTGVVTKIAIEGTSQSGVTTYPVTIQVNETENLKGGMNANAEIFTSVSQDVLVIPIEAVTKMGTRAFVWVKGKPAANGNTTNNQGAGNENSSQGNGGKSNSGSAVAQGNYNRTAARGNSQMLQYYKDAVRKNIEVGINNDTYIEVVSGLGEGDVVVLPPIITTKSSTQSSTGGLGGFGGMGGLGGGGTQRVYNGGGGNGGNSRNNGSNGRNAD